MSHSPWRYCIAPMMDWSDRHCRYFWRLLSTHARLYTEMVTTGAILHGDRERFLRYNTEEHPLALQLGGSDPSDLASCAKYAEDAGFDEVNLNCGCPSDRVQNGKIGACLMAEPNLVGECLSAMNNAVKIPVTVKHRIGIDDYDTWEHLDTFVKTQIEAGCDVFIVHARKAWLQGLSPKQNREIPPLDYERVKALKRSYPEQTFVINGGITEINDAKTLLEDLDGVMIGREAYHNPYSLALVDELLFNDNSKNVTRDGILEEFANYCEEQIKNGQRLHSMSRHILGLYLGEPGARKFRRFLSENANKPDANGQTILQAKNAMNQ